ncbi:MAG: class I SAM-dependent methyltransferase [Alphaproteobacteria bacterium]
MKSAEVGAYWEGNAPAWIELSRAGYDVYRDALNTPHFLALLPQIDGQTGLDIGCGEGTNTRQLAERGAHMTAADIAPSFIKAETETEQADPRGITYQHMDATALDFADASFDFATAFMSFMDIPDQDKALAEVFRVLKPGGFFQFSILHPCFCPPHRKTLRDENGVCYAIEVGDYYRRTDGEVESWLFGAAPPEEREKHPDFNIPRFHRTLSDWVAMLTEAGFMLEALQEPKADEDTARAVPDVADTRITPLFLHLRLRKPA